METSIPCQWNVTSEFWMSKNIFLLKNASMNQEKYILQKSPSPELIVQNKCKDP